MQIEEAKKELNNLIFTLEIKHLGGAEAIETVLNELEKKDTVILEAISYIENTFELEDEKCITELYDILKRASEE